MKTEDHFLELHVEEQPAEAVSGPTCLHALYEYFCRPVPLDRIVDEVGELPHGGTLAVQLGYHALKNDFDATIYTSNLQTFDPTWFRPGVNLSEKLQKQAMFKDSQTLRAATETYLKFIDHGGEIRLESPTLGLLRSYINRRIPILAGLSATYLYNRRRETPDGGSDDLTGTPSGHFIVIHGYNRDADHVLIADPSPNSGVFSGQHYTVDLERLLAAILLGIVTYDANLLVIEPRL